MYVSTDNGNIINFTNEFLEYSLEQKFKSTLFVFVFQLFGGRKYIFPPKTSLPHFSLKIYI